MLEKFNLYTSFINLFITTEQMYWIEADAVELSPAAIDFFQHVQKIPKYNVTFHEHHRCYNT